jgi:hypothetical protein
MTEQAQVAELIGILGMALYNHRNEWSGWLLAAVPFLGALAPWLVRLALFIGTPVFKAVWGAVRGPLWGAIVAAVTKKQALPPGGPNAGR